MKNSTRSPELPDAETLERLKISPEVAWYCLERGMDLPKEWQVPKIKTPEPRNVDGAVFDPARVDKVLLSFHTLRHTQGSGLASRLTLTRGSWCGSSPQCLDG